MPIPIIPKTILPQPSPPAIPMIKPTAPNIKGKSSEKLVSDDELLEEELREDAEDWPVEL